MGLGDRPLARQARRDRQVERLSDAEERVVCPGQVDAVAGEEDRPFRGVDRSERLLDKRSVRGEVVPTEP